MLKLPPRSEVESAVDGTPSDTKLILFIFPLGGLMGGSGPYTAPFQPTSSLNLTSTPPPLVHLALGSSGPQVHGACTYVGCQSVGPGPPSLWGLGAPPPRESTGCRRAWPLRSPTSTPLPLSGWL